MSDLDVFSVDAERGQAIDNALRLLARRYAVDALSSGDGSRLPEAAHLRRVFRWPGQEHPDPALAAIERDIHEYVRAQLQRVRAPGRWGLSTGHIFSQPVDVCPGSVEFWLGGSLATVRSSRVWVRLSGETVRGAKRGIIRTFTRSSRRRLMRLLARLRRDAMPYFVTLTYPRFFPGDPTVWKRHLKNFWMRLSRRYHDASFVWRLEPQRRGAPHFHLLIWGVNDIFSFRRWLSQVWYEVVGSGDVRHLAAGTSCEVCRSFKGVMSYASKYLAKEVDAEAAAIWDAGVGRWWGVYGRLKLPFARRVRFFISERDVATVMRYFRRYARLRLRSRVHSLTVFLDASQWFGKLSLRALSDLEVSAVSDLGAVVSVVT